MTRRERYRSVGLAAVMVVSVLAVAGSGLAVGAPDATAGETRGGGTAAPADAAAAGPADAAAAATELTECTVIDRPGRYELAANVTGDGTCIGIAASDVVLDGQGHAIRGNDTGAEGVGIRANASGGLSNVTVIDVVLERWAWNGFGNHGHAVWFEGVDDGRIADVSITGGDYGVRLTGTTNTTVADTSVRGTGDDPGVYLEADSDRNRLARTAIVDSEGRGLLVHSSSNNTFHRNRIAGSGGENVRLAWEASWNTFTDNVIRDTSWTDATVSVGQSASHLRFRNNTVAGSAANGIALSQAGADHVIENNTVRASGGHGIRLNRVANATVRNNVVIDSGGHGINLQRSSGHVVRDNEARSSERFGVNLNDVSDATVADNLIARHANGGIRLVSGSADNELRDNEIRNGPPEGVIAFPTGILLDGADRNEFVGNRIENAWRGVDVNASSANNTLTDTVIRNTGSATWALTIGRSNGTVVDRMDVGDSTAPNTTLSLTGYNVSVTATRSAPEHANARGIGRYFEARGLASDAALDVAVHYERGDVTDVDERTLALWRYDGSGWAAVDGSVVDTDARTVRATLTGFSTVGALPTGEVRTPAGTPVATSGPMETAANPSTTTATPVPTDTSAPTATATRTQTATAASVPTATATSGGTATPARAATPTPTAAVTTTTPSNPGGATTSGSGPGFGTLAGAGAVVAAGLLGLRRSER